MNSLVKITMISATLLFLCSCASPDTAVSAENDLTVLSDVGTNSTDTGQTPDTAIHNPAETVSNWQVALTCLQEGNRRFFTDQTMERTTNAEDRELLKDGQQPFAVIVTCSDSRVSPELYFDQKLGDIFVIRNAGNIADETALGSIEYAVEHLHTPLVVVVGHGSCGAVTGAFEGGEFPSHLQTIISQIEVSIENSSDLNDAIHKNINSVVGQIAENEIVHETNAKVTGAYYDIVTGEVIWTE